MSVRDSARDALTAVTDFRIALEDAGADAEDIEILRDAAAVAIEALEDEGV